MHKELTVKKSVKLNADSRKVWDALTNPQLTKQYMYNCEILCDWKVGSPLIWKGAEDGKVYVKGNIVSIDPGRRLQFTTFDPNSEMQDTPLNYTTVTYELSPQNGTTELTVTQGDFSKVVDGEKRYNHTVGGWDYALKGLKELLEK
jgi:uncharacterized protein YndB with AHSA1/START domain